MSNRKNKKLDTAIVVALIGLTGTIVTALLASPLLEKLLVGTAVPTEGGSNSDSVLVFSEDFEKGHASGLSFTSEEWQVVQEEGSSVLEASGTRNGNTAITFGPNDFADGIIQFRLFFRNFDGFILSFRSAGSETYTLYFAPSSEEIKFGYGNSANGWKLEPFENGLASFHFAENVWYDVKLEVKGAQMTLWVDDKKLLASSDSRLKQGGMEFAVQDTGTVLLDDIEVYQSTP